MKKLLALGLSLAMMASLSAVAFAVDETIADGKGTVTQVGENKNALDVVVKTQKPEIPGSADKFVVTIPADHTFEWGVAGSYTLDAKVKGQMDPASSVKVEVDTPMGELQLTNDTLGGYVGANLAFKEGTVLGSALGGLNGAEVICGTGSVTVNADSFATANSVGEYSAPINYLVTYQAAQG